MQSVIDKQKLNTKRLSQHRDKLKYFCGQLNLECIPENVGQSSPRDQAQILLNSYRTNRLEVQLQQPSRDYLGEKYGKEGSSMTLSNMISPKSTDRFKSVRGITEGFNRQLGTSSITERNEAGKTEREPQLTQFEKFSIQMRQSRPFFGKQLGQSPSQHEGSTGKMSPVTQIQQLLKQNVPQLKQLASQTYFEQLQKHQIQAHEMSIKASRASGDRKASAGSSGGDAYVNPLTYYENRYFPFGFDDPNKVTVYNHRHHRAGSKKTQELGPEQEMDQDVNEQTGIEADKALKSIKDYESKVDEVVGRHIESSIEADFDRRTKLNDEPNSTLLGRYQKAAKDRKFSTIDSNASFVENYLSGGGVGLGTLKRRHLPEKMSKQKSLMSKSLIRSGFAMASSSIPMSPGLNQWAASGSIALSSTNRAMDPKVLAALRQSITSGETVLLGELNQAEASKTQNLTAQQETVPSLSIQLPEIAARQAPQTDQRNSSLNKMRSDSYGMNTSRVFRQSHSKDLREELINHRIMTQLRLENMNIKIPQTWKSKEEAYQRFKEMKNQMAHKDSAVKIAALK